MPTKLPSEATLLHIETTLKQLARVDHAPIVDETMSLITAYRAVLEAGQELRESSPSDNYNHTSYHPFTEDHKCHCPCCKAANKWDALLKTREVSDERTYLSL